MKKCLTLFSVYMKGAFVDSLGRDYYVIGTAADIQVFVIHSSKPSKRYKYKCALSFENEDIGIPNI